MESNFSDSMCRCCASEGVFKDFNSTYQWMGAEEVYADMLKDCFDITLTVSETINSGGICEVCITQLRNAFNFKKQVQYTEEQFKRKIEEMKFKTEIVKVEEAGEDDFPSDHNLSDDDFSSPEYDIPIIKMESSSESAKSKKRATKGATTRSKKAKTEDGETSAKRTVCPVKVHIKNTKSSIEQKKAIPKTKVISLERKKREIPLKKAEAPKVNLLLKKKVEIEKHLENIRLILTNSNATPIRCREGFSFACCFCNNQFSTPELLKRHTVDNHNNSEIEDFMQGSTVVNYIVKLDITGLKCKLCGENIAELDDLIQHLTDEHEKKYHCDIRSHIVPFRFASGELRCVVCKNKLNNFKVLIEHMNMHFKNYQCSVCGAGFVNKRTLQTHGYRHKTGVFSCSFCHKVYDNSIKKRDHERGVHILRNKRSKCGYCGEKFTDYTKKNDHEVKIHGAVPVVLQCQACDKSFSNQRALTMHTKSFHLLQRKKADKGV
ncbi:zinc finger protein weckle-like isoform X16 [Leptidea sinapis]|uniref:zinc finger protein weckle-like isoform X16 n=1 Tax=Leptidea sinapis TaxID=189913 RepID=UPI0021C44DD6|nr:zinc finger protein weckle-like isoform X16 [Leptidea sinapis]